MKSFSGGSNEADRKVKGKHHRSKSSSSTFMASLPSRLKKKKQPTLKFKRRKDHHCTTMASSDTANAPDGANTQGGGATSNSSSNSSVSSAASTSTAGATNSSMVTAMHRNTQKKSDVIHIDVEEDTFKSDNSNVGGGRVSVGRNDPQRSEELLHPFVKEEGTLPDDVHAGKYAAAADIYEPKKRFQQRQHSRLKLRKNELFREECDQKQEEQQPQQQNQEEISSETAEKERVKTGVEDLPCASTDRERLNFLSAGTESNATPSASLIKNNPHASSSIVTPPTTTTSSKATSYTSKRLGRGHHPFMPSSTPASFATMLLTQQIESLISNHFQTHKEAYQQENDAIIKKLRDDAAEAQKIIAAQQFKISQREDEIKSLSRQILSLQSHLLTSRRETAQVRQKWKDHQDRLNAWCKNTGLQMLNFSTAMNTCEGNMNMDVEAGMPVSTLSATTTGGSNKGSSQSEMTEDSKGLSTSDNVSDSDVIQATNDNHLNVNSNVDANNSVSLDANVSNKIQAYDGKSFTFPNSNDFCVSKTSDKENISSLSYHFNGTRLNPTSNPKLSDAVSSSDRTSTIGMKSESELSLTTSPRKKTDDTNTQSKMKFEVLVDGDDDNSSSEDESLQNESQLSNVSDRSNVLVGDIKLMLARNNSANATVPNQISKGPSPQNVKCEASSGMAASSAARYQNNQPDQDIAGDRIKRTKAVASTTNMPYFCAPVGLEQKANPRIFKRPRRHEGDPVQTISATSTIKPKVNDDTATKASRNPCSFQYQEVVRGKRAREQLLGYDCEECQGFLNAVCNAPGGNVFDRGNLIQRCSRHRARYRPPETPDGFWDLSFVDEKATKNQIAQELSEQAKPKFSQSQESNEKLPASGTSHHDEHHLDDENVSQGSKVHKRAKGCEEHEKIGESSQNSSNLSRSTSALEESMVY